MCDIRLDIKRSATDIRAKEPKVTLTANKIGDWLAERFSGAPANDMLEGYLGNGNMKTRGHETMVIRLHRAESFASGKAIRKVRNERGLDSVAMACSIASLKYLLK